MAESQVKKLNEKDFENQVLKSPKPALVKFSAPWCHGCQVLKPIINEFAAKHSEKIEIFDININNNPKIASHYHIMSIPTILVFNKEKIVNHIVSGVSLKELEKKLSDYI